ncbi:hypothetical protein PT974_08206 [Cladobotryum mycophilum]|uniref:Guanine nucleotide-exchange factor SEC12 n=1 Tax=Cladobotryum mycophilum TaxID=491253 RepID=A0ABR0SCQ6_9HYPO
MASPFRRASIALDYPLYSLSFDPEDANRLVVGGGGGTSRSGVGNKITVLETASQDELRIAGEFEISRDEDSVMSLAFAGSKGKTSYIFAGVNSSPQEVEKGTNHHLRALAIEQSKARASAGAKTPEVIVTELSRSAFFEKPNAETYQRVLRISGQVGAAASGFGKDPQLVVFDASVPKPKIRGVMELPRDAEELDIIQTGEGEYLVAFCYKYELYLVKVGKENSEPELIYTMQDDHGERPAFRTLRFLTPDFLLAVSNLPKQSGALIQGFRLPSPGHEKARIAANVRIPKRISATALAVANVSPATPTSDTQFAIAVAASDSSIYLYTVEHKILSSIGILFNLHPLYALKNAHFEENITGVAFSNPVPPKSSTRTQFLKLASITLHKNLAVHSIPLKKHVDKAAGNPKAPPKPERYVIAMRSKAPSNRGVVITLSIMVLILAIVGQGILEIYGKSKPVIHAHRFLPGLYGSLRDPVHTPEYFSSQEYLVSKLAGTAKPEGETLVMWESEHPATAIDGGAVGDIKLDVHDEDVHGQAKSWEELSEKQKRAWQEKLRGAGAWTQNMGESVFKGILFGELAGAVGRAVAG